MGLFGFGKKKNELPIKGEMVITFQRDTNLALLSAVHALTRLPDESARVAGDLVSRVMADATAPTEGKQTYPFDAKFDVTSAIALITTVQMAILHHREGIDAHDTAFVAAQQIAKQIGQMLPGVRVEQVKMINMEALGVYVPFFKLLLDKFKETFGQTYEEVITTAKYFPKTAAEASKVHQLIQSSLNALNDLPAGDGGVMVRNAGDLNSVSDEEFAAAAMQPGVTVH